MTTSVITLNGSTFGRGKASVVDSLFSGPRTLGGYYTRSRGGVTLFNVRGERIGGINRHGVLHRSARLEDGRWWHSYGQPDGIAEYESYSRGVDEAREALRIAAAD